MTKQEREVCVMCSISVVEGKKVICGAGLSVKDCPIQQQKNAEKLGVLEQIAAKQKTLSDSTKAWAEYIDKHGEIY